MSTFKTERLKYASCLKYAKGVLAIQHTKLREGIYQYPVLPIAIENLNLKMFYFLILIREDSLYVFNDVYV